MNTHTEPNLRFAAPPRPPEAPRKEPLWKWGITAVFIALMLYACSYLAYHRKFEEDRFRVPVMNSPYSLIYQFLFRVIGYTVNCAGYKIATSVGYTHFEQDFCQRAVQGFKYELTPSKFVRKYLCYAWDAKGVGSTMTEIISSTAYTFIETRCSALRDPSEGPKVEYAGLSEENDRPARLHSPA